MPTRDLDTKGRIGNQTETHAYIVSVTTTIDEHKNVPTLSCGRWRYDLVARKASR